MRRHKKDKKGDSGGKGPFKFSRGGKESSSGKSLSGGGEEKGENGSVVSSDPITSIVEDYSDISPPFMVRSKKKGFSSLQDNSVPPVSPDGRPEHLSLPNGPGSRQLPGTQSASQEIPQCTCSPSPKPKTYSVGGSAGNVSPSIQRYSNFDNQASPRESGVQLAPAEMSPHHSPSPRPFPQGAFKPVSPSRGMMQPGPISVTAVVENSKPDTHRDAISGSNDHLYSVRPKTLSPSMTHRLQSPPSPLVHGAPPPAVLGGEESPSSQSMTSMVSVIAALPADGHKQTLGDILQQIELKSRSLLQMEDFTTLDPYPDLQYLSHQSRYSSDVHIKRRLIGKLVENHVLDIFLRVFRSVHTVDYLKGPPNLDTITEQPEEGSGGVSSKGSKDRLGDIGFIDGDDAQHDIMGDYANKSRPTADKTTDSGYIGDSASQGASAEALPDTDRRPSTGMSCRDSPSHGDSSHRASRESLISTHSKDGTQHESGSDKSAFISDALRNLRAAVTLMSNATDKSPLLCEECIKKGVIQLLLKDLADSQFANSDLKDHHELYLVKGYLTILNNIVRFYNDARDIFRDAHALKILQPYLRSLVLLVKTKTMILLSYIINESENDVINASDKSLGFVLKILQATLDSENHYSKKFNFWAVEVAAGRY